MFRKRIGNDIAFVWRVYRKDKDTDTVEPEDFEGKDVTVKLISPLQRAVEIENITISTGVVKFSFKGKNQHVRGTYTAVLQENKGTDGMATLDVVDAVILVEHSYMEEDGDDGDVIEAEAVELTSTISAGGGGGIEQQQADWAQTDDTAVNFIKHKPDLEEYAMLRNPNRFTETQVIEDERYRATFTQQYIELRDKAIPSNPALRITINGIYKIPNAGTINGVVWEETATSQIPAATISAPGLMSAEDKSKLNDLPTATELAQELGRKQDTINDLPAIRSGAQAGATAVQPSDLDLYVPRTDDDGHGNMSLYGQGGIYMALADEQGIVNSTGSFGAGGWFVSSPRGTFQTAGNTIYRGTIGIDEDSVVWEKTATQQIPAATTKTNGLMSATDKEKIDGLADKQDKMPIVQVASSTTLSAVVGNYYRLDNVGTLAITLPTITGATKLQAIKFLLVCGSSALVTFAPQGSETILYQEDFALETDTTYEVTASWNGSEWTLSRVIYG